MPSLPLMRPRCCDAEVVPEVAACFGEGEGCGQGEVVGEDAGLGVASGGMGQS